MSYNFFLPYLKMFFNKLECLSVIGLSNLVSCLLVQPEPTQMKKISREGRHLALLTKIRLGWKGLAGTNIVAYFKH